MNGDNVEQMDMMDQIDLIGQSQSQSQSAEIISDNVLNSNLEFVVTSYPIRSRPRKIGRALGVEDAVVEAVTEIATKKQIEKNES